MSSPASSATGTPVPVPSAVSVSEPDLLERPGYHLRRIPRGELGELSKVQEELRELEDAMAQGSRIMAAVEVSDLVGALRAFMERHLPGLTLEDAVRFNNITRRAFENGHRSPR